MTVTVNGIEELKALAGADLGRTGWMEMTQDRVNTFADATGDHQWIHVDPERAAACLFGGTIAHGYLTLSVVIPLFNQLLQVSGISMGINYGLNKAREFPAPVPVGSKIRLAGRLGAIESVGTNAVQVVADFTIEVEGSDKPACVAQAVYRYYVGLRSSGRCGRAGVRIFSAVTIVFGSSPSCWVGRRSAQRSDGIAASMTPAETALSGLLRPGMTVAFGDGFGAPLSLAGQLGEAAAEHADIRLILGWMPYLDPPLDLGAFGDVRTFMPGWGLRAGTESGLVRFAPVSLSGVPALLHGPWRPDLLVATMVPVPGGFAFGTEVSWQRAAIAAGATVAAVVSRHAPRADAGDPVPPGRVIVVGHAEHPPAAMA